MILASASFSVMAALVKALGPGFPFPEVLLFRSLLSLPAVLLVLHRRGLSLAARRVRLLLLRGLLGWGGMSCSFFALQRGLLADISVISRLQPILVALLAPWIIGERSPGAALLAMAAGLAGVLLVVRPGGVQGINPAYLVALLGTLFSALAHLAVRRLNVTHPPWVIVAWFTLVVGLASGVAAAPVLIMPDGQQMILLAGVALSATCGQFLMTTAYGRETAPVVAAATYSSVAFALVIGLLVWGELPDPLALAGGGVIVCTGVGLALARRCHVPPAE